MTDVGILNLQIRDDSAKAAEGLDKLASSLERVKAAVGNGIKLSGIAKQLSEINNAMQKAIPEQSIAQLERLAGAIEKINAAGGIKLSGIKDLMTNSDTGNAFENVRGAVSEVSDSLMENMQGAVQEVQEQVESTAGAITETLEEHSTQWKRFNPFTGLFEDEEKVLAQLEEHKRKVQEIAEAQRQAELSADFLSDQKEYLRAGDNDWLKESILNKYGLSETAFLNADSYEQAISHNDEFFESITRVEQQYQEFMDMLNTPIQINWADAIDQMLHIDSEFKNAAESMSAFMQEMQGDNATAAQIRELNPELQEFCEEAIRSGTQVSDLTTELVGLDGELKTKQTDVANTASAFSVLGEKMKGLIAPITNLWHQFSRIVRYRIMRTVIKEITEAVSEGTENYYRYSQAINSSFAGAMDSAASALLKMKNSIGAALAPLIQELIPYLQQAVNWFITVVNYANQFISLLRGQSTWSRATDQSAKAFDDVKKSASGAAAAIKDLLADWDELNIIQSENGGTGGSGSGTKAMEDYLGMFEEVGEFDSRIKAIVGFLKDNLEKIKVMAAAIGAAILGWKISNAFADTISWLSKLGSGIAAAATIVLTVALSDLTGKEYMDTGEAGWLIADALTGAVGSTIARRLADKVVGKAGGEIVQGVTLVLSGLVNIKNAVSEATQERKGRAFVLAALGSLETGIGSALIAAGAGATMAGSLLTGLTVGGASMVIATTLILEAVRRATYRQMAIDAFNQQSEEGISPSAYLAELQTRLDELTAGSKLVINTWIEFDQNSEKFKEGIENLKAMNALVKSGEALTAEEAEAFKTNWETVISALNSMNEVSAQTIYKGLAEVIANGSEELQKAAREARQMAIDLVAETQGIDAAIEKKMEYLIKDIVSGKATDEQIAEYDKLYNAVAQSSDSGISKLKKSLTEGMNFDFSEGDGANAVENAVSFIQNMQENYIQPALDEVQQAYDSEIAALDEQKAALQRGLDADIINETQYAERLEQLKSISDIYKTYLDEQQKEILAETENVYQSILQQAVSGIGNIDATDAESAKAYAENVMQPIITAMEELGYEIPEATKATVERLMSGGTLFFDAQEAAENLARSAIYESYLDTNPENAETMSLAYELDLVGSNVDLITDDVKRDIINSYVDVFGDMPQTFERLSQVFGWTMEDIIGNLDLSGYTDEEIADLQDTLDLLNLDIPITVNNGEPIKIPHMEFEDDQVETTGKLWTTKNIVASAGVSDVKYGRSYENGEQELVVKQDSSEQKANVQSGVMGGTVNIVNVLNSIMSMVNSINQKDFSVNVNVEPTSGLGRVVDKSRNKYSRVTGNVAMES